MEGQFSVRLKSLLHQLNQSKGADAVGLQVRQDICSPICGWSRCGHCDMTICPLRGSDFLLTTITFGFHYQRWTVPLEGPGLNILFFATLRVVTVLPG